MENRKQSGIGTVILAFILLVSGFVFGAWNISNCLRAYKNIPSDEQIHRMEEYLGLMEDLAEILDDPAKLESLDADSYLDRKLENCDLTESQERDIRKFYNDILARARGSLVDQEQAMNSLIRETNYYQQTIPNPAHIRSHLRTPLIIGGVSILLSLLLFTVLMKKPAA